MNMILRTALAAGMLLVLAEPAWANANCTKSQSFQCDRAAPAPLAGAGIPALGAFGLGVLALRRRKRR